MKHYPIIFSAPMVLANHRGDKTETRRLNGLDLVNAEHFGQPLGAWPLSEFRGFEGDRAHWRLQTDVDAWTDHYHHFAFGQPGDGLYVRENWRVENQYDKVKPNVLAKRGFLATDAWFDADGDAPEWFGKCRPSIHLPQTMSRTILTGTDRRLERLQDITEVGARAEGVRCLQEPGRSLSSPDGLWYNYLDGTLSGACTSARDSFRTLWTKIHGAGLYTWEFNPFVYVITYTIIT